MTFLPSHEGDYSNKKEVFYFQQVKNVYPNIFDALNMKMKYQFSHEGYCRKRKKLKFIHMLHGMLQGLSAPYLTNKVSSTPTSQFSTAVSAMISVL